VVFESGMIGAPCGERVKSNVNVLRYLNIPVTIETSMRHELCEKREGDKKRAAVDTGRVVIYNAGNERYLLFLKRLGPHRIQSFFLLRKMGN
jgi:hypothetical protein